MRAGVVVAAGLALASLALGTLGGEPVSSLAEWRAQQERQKAEGRRQKEEAEKAAAEFEAEKAKQEAAIAELNAAPTMEERAATFAAWEAEVKALADQGQEAARREREEQAARAARRASVVVTNSAWDGSVWQVKMYLQEVLHDPWSVKYASWSPVTRWAKGWAVGCRFRAKNACGAYVLENWVFYLDEDGEVVKARPAGE